MACVIVLTHILDQEIEHLIGWTHGVFLMIYLASMLAVAKLLSKRYLPLVCLGSGFCILLGVALGASMLYITALIMLLAPLLWWQKLHIARNEIVPVI